MKNRLENLNDHLFVELERLTDEDLTDEEIEKEIKRAKAVAAISSQIVRNASVVLEAKKLDLEYGERVAPVFIAGKEPKQIMAMEVADDEVR